MPGSAFPLDAEQIVRLTGTLLARVLNAIRHPDAPKVAEDELILALGERAGVPIATQEVTWRGLGDARHTRSVLAPYGYVRPVDDGLTPSSGSPLATGAEAPSAGQAAQSPGEADA